MNAEIPNRICNAAYPSPKLKETVSVKNGMGVFDIFLDDPINQGFQWTEANNVSYTKEPSFNGQKQTRSVRQKVVDFTKQLGMNGEEAVLASIIPFSTDIIDVGDETELTYHGEQGFFTHEGGAVFTTLKGIPFYSLITDCTQTIFYANKSNGEPVVGIIHAGRNETDNMFPFKAIQHAMEKYDIDPKDIKLGTSPSLEPKHHKIQKKDVDRVIDNLKIWEPYMLEVITEKLIYLDLRSFVADQFMAAGVLPQNIELSLQGLYDFHRNDVVVSHRKSTELQLPMTCLGIAVEIK
jgi:copper oxidase (laccase) domain-containing protein